MRGEIVQTRTFLENLEQLMGSVQEKSVRQSWLEAECGKSTAGKSYEFKSRKTGLKLNIREHRHSTGKGRVCKWRVIFSGFEQRKNSQCLGKSTVSSMTRSARRLWACGRVASFGLCHDFFNPPNPLVVLVARICYWPAK